MKSDEEATAEAAVEHAWKNLPTDAFAEILLRVPRISRRRFRLVCRHWRDVIDDRIPWTQPVKALVFCRNRPSPSASAYVVDDLPAADDGGGARCREIWRHDDDDGHRRYEAMVGTCNGLLCLWADTRRNRAAGEIVLVNPFTGETLDVPPCPKRRIFYEPWTACSFGFHRPTGRYKIVQLPREGQGRVFGGLRVFTLGDDDAWRHVVIPGGGSSFLQDAGMVTVDGSTYWVTADDGGARRVVQAFDLGDERVTSVPLPPVELGRYGDRQLAEVNGTLGLAVVSEGRWTKNVEVWVLDHRHRQGGSDEDDADDAEGRRCRWSRRYSVQLQNEVDQQLARPHFAHGEHVLVTDAWRWWYRWLTKVFAHRLPRDDDEETTAVIIMERGVAACGITAGSYICGLFAYIETEEPLSCYRRQQAT